MKTIKLFTLLLGITILSSVGSAKEIKQDADKYGTPMKSQKQNQKNAKSDTEKSAAARFSPKAYQKADWTRKSYEDEYPRGKIRTH